MVEKKKAPAKKKGPTFAQVVDQAIRGDLGKGQTMRLNIEKLGFSHVKVAEAVTEKVNGR